MIYERHFSNTAQVIKGITKSFQISTTFQRAVEISPPNSSGIQKERSCAQCTIMSSRYTLLRAVIRVNSWSIGELVYDPVYM